jgi:hypothetical protein
VAPRFLGLDRLFSNFCESGGRPKYEGGSYADHGINLVWP